MAQTTNSEHVAWVAIGSFCSFGFAIVSSMILSRYFNKADYGTYKQVMYVYNTLLLVFTLGLPKAFPYFLPRVKLTQSKSLILKITRLFFILGGLFSLLLFLFAPQISRILNNQELTKAIRVFAIVPFLLLPTMGLEGILATFKKNKVIALYNILTNLFRLFCVAVPVMIWNLGYVEALVGFVFASAITFALTLYLQYYPLRGVQHEKCNITYKEIFQFSIPLLVASLWGIVISSSDQFFISRFFGREVFAEFSNGFMSLPFIGMVTGACSTVLSPLFSKLSYEQVDPQKEIYPIWKSVFEKSAKLIYPFVIYCMVFADMIMILLYGDKYVSSGGYFRIKLVADFFAIIIYAPLLINIGKVKFYSNVHMVVAIAVVLLEFISVKTIHSAYAISWVSVCCQIGKVFALLWAVTDFFKVRLYQLFPIRLIGLIIIPSSIFLMLERWLLIDIFHLNCFVVLGVSFGVYLLCYYGYSILMKMDYASIIKPLFIRNRE